MIKKLRLKCHSLSSSASGYTLPAEVGNKESCATSVNTDLLAHSNVESTLCHLNGVVASNEFANQMVGYYDPLAKGLTSPGKLYPAVENGTTLRSHGLGRLCYSDDDAGARDLPEGCSNLVRGMKSISLNEESTLCCGGQRYQQADSLSAEEEEEETHMSWIEIMAKKRELEKSLKQKGADGLPSEGTVGNLNSKNVKNKTKRSCLFSSSFKLRDLFLPPSSATKQKKPRKSKAHPRSGNPLGPTLGVRGQTSSGRRSSPSDDPSPVLFDLHSRGLPAIPFEESEVALHRRDEPADVGLSILRCRERNSCERDARTDRAGSSGSGDVFIDSFNELKNKGWYWGPLSWKEAEEQLRDKPTGSFLVRDSSDCRYILSLTFKSDDKIHHTRIEHYRGQFSFNSQPKSLGAATIVEFIEKAVENCADGSFSYFLRPRGPGIPPTMFRLVRPVSRFTKVHSLQHLCRFVILSRIRRDKIDQLPMPSLVKKYLACTQYYIE